MKSRTFGRTGWQVGEVGLGCWQLGGGDWGDVSDARALAILHTAIESGVNFLDTADVYGAGRSETLIGRFLKKSRAPVKVATKLGRMDLYPDRYTEANLRKATEASLKRLGVDTIDLTQLHCIPTDVMRQGEVFEWLRRQQRDGLIRNFGASVESMEEARICVEQTGLTSLQIIFNIFRQKPITTLFPIARQKGIAIIVRLPLASGLLSGKMRKDHAFAASDHRLYNRNGECFNVGETFAGLPFEQGVELADALKPHVPAGMTMAQMAMRWILDHDAVSVIIPGASRIEQVTSNAAVSDLPSLSRDLHEHLTSFHQHRVATHIRGPD
jgi:aryl-alcohol dehydrogenase-like predicted oxidoreductase